MPDQASSFEYRALEEDLKTLAAEIRRNEEHGEMKNVEGIEIVKEAIRAFPQRSNDPASVPSPQAQSNSPLPAYAQSAPAEVKLEIEYLLDVAFKHGMSKALAEAEKSPDFVRDAFHDALAGRLYPELQKRGMVK